MLQEHNTRTGFFEEAEFRAVRDALPEELRGIVTLSYYCGWRIKSEILPLAWSNVDRELKVIRLDAHATKTEKGRVLPYGKLPELVTVIDPAWTAHTELAAAGTLSPYVFQRNGKPVKDIRAASDAPTEAAGCPTKLLHDFRRTAVRNVVRRGVADKTAMMITGHKTRSVFDRYDIVTERDIEDGLAKLSDQPVAARKGQVKRFKKR